MVGISVAAVRCRPDGEGIGGIGLDADVRVAQQRLQRLGDFRLASVARDRSDKPVEGLAA